VYFKIFILHLILILVFLKEERLERLAESHKLNGSITNGLKKSDEELHAHEVDPGLTFTHRFCGGLMDDIKRKAPWFLSDFKDGLNFQCLSAILFMYFACLSPIITFGGLLGAATDQNMVHGLFS
jgi:sodium bicarbonate cotransporter 7